RYGALSTRSPRSGSESAAEPASVMARDLVPPVDPAATTAERLPRWTRDPGSGSPDLSSARPRAFTAAAALARRRLEEHRHGRARRAQRVRGALEHARGDPQLGHPPPGAA